jgi:hypothetical protein
MMTKNLFFFLSLSLSPLTRWLAQIPHLRPAQYSRVNRRDRSVTRAYGGSRCGTCVKNRIIRAFLIEEKKVATKATKVKVVKKSAVQKAAEAAAKAQKAKADKEKKKKEAEKLHVAEELKKGSKAGEWFTHRLMSIGSIV